METDDTKKLKLRREAEERALIERRKKSSKTTNNKGTVVFDNVKLPDIEKDIKEYPIRKVSLKDVPNNETHDQKKDRFLKSREEIFDKHSKLINLKHAEAEQKIKDSLQKELDEAKTEHDETLQTHKTELDEDLEDAEDAEEKRSLVSDYKKEVKDENEYYRDRLREINDEHESSIKDLAEECEQYLIDVKQQYEIDVELINEDKFNDDDLRLAADNLESADITFDALDQYESEESESEESDSGGYSLSRMIVSVVSIGLILIVGLSVISELNSTMNQSQNITSTMNQSQNIMIFENPWFVWMIALIPILWFIMKRFRILR